MASVRIDLTWNSALFRFLTIVDVTFRAPHMKILGPIVGYRFCSLSPLPYDTIRRFIREKFRGFAANLGGLVTTRGLFEEVGANFLLFSPDTSAATK